MPKFSERFISRIGSPKDITKQSGTFSLDVYGTFFQGAFKEYMSELYDFDFGAFAFFGKENYGILFFSLEAYEKTTRVGWERFKKIKNIENFIDHQKYHSYRELIFKFYDEVLARLNKMPEEELVEKLKLPAHHLSKLLVSTVFCEAYQEVHLAEFYEQLKGKSIPDDFKAMAMKPGFTSFVTEFNRLIVNYKSEKDIAWMFADYYSAVPKEKIKEKIEHYILEKGGIETIKQSLKQSDEIIIEQKKELEAFRETRDEEERILFDFTQYAMELRDRRKEPLQKLMTTQYYLTEEYLKRRGIAIDLAPFCSSYDFVEDNFLATDFQEQLERRKNNFFLYADNDYHVMIDDAEIIKAEEQSLLDLIKSLHPEQDVIKGSIACKGFVASATAKVIHSQKDFDIFNEGDVLITSMTRPEFVPLMRKASAVITDEGGVTCHAAIISRELNIPCIIGTKFATQILKSGDTIEVDANKGIIKKL